MAPPSIISVDMRNKILVIASVIIFLLLFQASYAKVYHEGQYGRGLYGRTGGTVSFSMELKINGASGDTADIDGNGAGYYKGYNLENYYGCVQDNGAFGIVAGRPSL